MAVTVRQVELFLAVAEELHFGRAAARLMVSQPVVSQEVARLERQVGGRLLDRTSRSVQLTELGRQLLPEAQEVLAAVHAFSAKARSLTAPGEATVRVACTPSVANLLLPMLLREAESATGIDVRETLVETGGAVPALLGGEADVAIGHHLVPGGGAHVRTVGRERLAVVAAAENAAALASPLGVLAVAHLPVLLWPKEQAPVYHSALLAVCRRAGLDAMVLTGPAKFLGVRSYLISENRCFALLPASVAAHLPAGLVAHLLPPEHTVPLDVAWVPARAGAEIGHVIDLAIRAATVMTARTTEQD